MHGHFARLGRLGRREFLRAGALPLMGLGLADLLRTGAGAAQTRRADAVLFIFMSGGPSQLDIWDLKPDAPAEVRGEFKPVATAVPGMQICEHLPRLARRAGKFALLRSLTHKSNLHSNGHAMILAGVNDVPVGFDANRPTRHDWPSLAAVAGRLLPGRGGFPGSVVLPHPLVHRTGRVIPGQFAGWLGNRFDPWVATTATHCTGYGACPDCFHFEGLPTRHASEPLFGPPGELRLHPTLSAGRLGRRMNLLQQVEQQRRDLESSAVGPVDEYRRRAVSMLTAPQVARAFDLNAEPDKVRDAYGRNQFGNSLLLARRLIESGVGLVQVNLGNNETWDTHQSAFPLLRDKLLPTTDRCLSALLDDLEGRGMLERTLIVTAGEFGRTPKISSLPGAAYAGRDHWGPAQSCFVAGGGIRGGTIVGATDAIGAFPAREPASPADLAATIYSAVGIDPRSELRDELGRPLVINDGRPIAGLLG
jgi:uncharacterized protein (DUF1501 family)